MTIHEFDLDMLNNALIILMIAFLIMLAYGNDKGGYS